MQNLDKDSILLELSQIAVALSANRDIASLQSQIIESVIRIFASDGATLYILSEDEQNLVFKVVYNTYLDIKSGGSWSPVTIPSVPMYEDGGKPNDHAVSAAALHRLETINIDDVYAEDRFDMQGVKNFDNGNNYRTQSILTVPMMYPNGDRLGVLQIINPRNDNGELARFSSNQQLVGRAIASQASVAYSNHQMVAEQEKLWQAMMSLMVRSIDEKSPYTSGHCQRVPILAQYIARAVDQHPEGRYGNVTLSPDEMYELDVAALLHDVGKLSTPEYVVDKSTKLETVFNRLHLIRTRFEVLWRDARIAELEAVADGVDAKMASEERIQQQQALSQQFAQLAAMNLGQTPLSDEDNLLLKQLSETHFSGHFPQDIGVSPQETKVLEQRNYYFESKESVNVLNTEEDAQLYVESEWSNMNIARGTLNDSERAKINDHAAAGIRMLQELPFPKKLQKVVTIAGAHHEKLDGTGYPNRLTAKDLPLRARILALADVYEALSAADRPYKTPKTETECLRILAFMAKDRHIDAELLRIFIVSGQWEIYGSQHLQPQQRDDVDVDKILAMFSDVVEKE